MKIEISMREQILIMTALDIRIESETEFLSMFADKKPMELLIADSKRQLTALEKLKEKIASAREQFNQGDY